MDTKLSNKSVLGFLSAAVLLWAGMVSDASVQRKVAAPKPVLPVSTNNICKEDLNILQAKGTFETKPGTPMALYLGYPNAKAAFAKKLQARLASVENGTETCKAVCQQVHYSKYKSDGHPQLIQLECTDENKNSVKTPVFIEWTKTENTNYEASIRMGSMFTKIVSAPIQIKTLEPTPLSLSTQWAKR